jgi:hypothetical protein
MNARRAIWAVASACALACNGCNRPVSTGGFDQDAVREMEVQTDGDEFTLANHLMCLGEKTLCLFYVARWRDHRVLLAEVEAKCASGGAWLAKIPMERRRGTMLGLFMSVKSAPTAILFDGTNAPLHFVGHGAIRAWEPVAARTSPTNPGAKQSKPPDGAP